MVKESLVTFIYTTRNIQYINKISINLRSAWTNLSIHIQLGNVYIN